MSRPRFRLKICQSTVENNHIFCDSVRGLLPKLFTLNVKHSVATFNVLIDLRSVDIELSERLRLID